jgi:hypothetical protein
MEFLRLTLWQANSQRQRLGSVLFDKIEQTCLQNSAKKYFCIFKYVLATPMLECFGMFWTCLEYGQALAWSRWSFAS